ncbi:hypothetical protein [Corynebacterium durum]|uniref:hypothetical protein n=1 Tax=Corynebacterium durum TaxID=61592 RepID=UPI00389B078A
MTDVNSCHIEAFCQQQCGQVSACFETNNSHINGDTVVNGFAPATVASEFDIDGNANLDRLTIVLRDSTLEGAINHYTDSRIAARESEYLCAQISSHITAVCNGEIVDFESVTVFDVHVNSDGPDLLLRRTVVAYVKVIFYCRYF